MPYDRPAIAAPDRLIAFPCTGGRLTKRTSDPSGKAGTVRVGIGGWSYDPWRETFYPADVPKKKELGYASSQVTAIEVNATYYRTQSPTSFARWRDETPDDFVFAVKASRFATNRKVLADARESIEFFVGSGLEELGPKLGPLLWQFMPTKRFDEDDFAGFLDQLPKKIGSISLRHALDVRHESFRCEAFVALARRHGAAIVCSDSDDYPMIGDVTADFVYARLMRARAEEETGYPKAGIAAWTSIARSWAAGETPDSTGALATAAPVRSRDAYVFFINGAKERAPAGARAMLAELS